MASAHTGQTILVIDDNRQLLDLITESLTLLGDYTVVTAENGADGLACAVESRPACAIIDVKMPGLDGYQLVRALRGDPATAGIPLIILTALIQDHYRFAGLLAGADHYLTKPIKPADLILAIQAAIELSQTERDHRTQVLLTQPFGEAADSDEN
ncbi:MAG TPA: response regulator [Ktedonobacterales bacterium]|nr:response regulator [Ktedonobacterales bacterium]